MLKKNKNIEWISQNPNKKIKLTEHFESTPAPSFQGVKLWLDASQYVGKDGQTIQKWQSLQNIAGVGSNIIDLESTSNKDNWPIVRENGLNKLPVIPRVFCSFFSSSTSFAVKGTILRK